MLLRLRSESIKYASNAKRKQNNLENKLKVDIEKLESESDDNPSNILEIKKMELEEIRSERMKGQWVRSHSQWNIEGKKPSKYFCSLETKNYLSKTIKCLTKVKGQSWGFTSRSTARVILGQVLRIDTCGTRTHRGDSL